jgi:hypothetical protein
MTGKFYAQTIDGEDTPNTEPIWGIYLHGDLEAEVGFDIVREDPGTVKGLLGTTGSYEGDVTVVMPDGTERGFICDPADKSNRYAATKLQKREQYL